MLILFVLFCFIVIDFRYLFCTEFTCRYICTESKMALTNKGSHSRVVQSSLSHCLGTRILHTSRFCLTFNETRRNKILENFDLLVEIHLSMFLKIFISFHKRELNWTMTKYLIVSLFCSKKKLQILFKKIVCNRKRFAQIRK